MKRSSYCEYKSFLFKRVKRIFHELTYTAKFNLESWDFNSHIQVTGPLKYS